MPGGPAINSDGEMQRPYRKKVIAQKIDAGKDRRRRQRKGWVISTTDGQMIGFLHEDDARLSDLFPKSVEIEELRVAPSEFISFVKHTSIWPAFPPFVSPL